MSYERLKVFADATETTGYLIEIT